MKFSLWVLSFKELSWHENNIAEAFLNMLPPSPLLRTWSWFSLHVANADFLSLEITYILLREMNRKIALGYLYDFFELCFNPLLYYIEVFFWFFFVLKHTRGARAPRSFAWLMHILQQPRESSITTPVMKVNAPLSRAPRMGGPPTCRLSPVPERIPLIIQCQGRGRNQCIASADAVTSISPDTGKYAIYMLLISLGSKTQGRLSSISLNLYHTMILDRVFRKSLRVILIRKCGLFPFRADFC